MLTMFKILHYVQEKDPFHFSYIFSAFFDRHLPQLSFNTITLLNCVFTILSETQQRKITDICNCIFVTVRHYKKLV